jgi:hypothetical protein
MPSAGFEPAIPASGWPQILAFDRLGTASNIIANNTVKMETLCFSEKPVTTDWVYSKQGQNVNLPQNGPNRYRTKRKRSADCYEILELYLKN